MTTKLSNIDVPSLSVKELYLLITKRYPRFRTLANKLRNETVNGAILNDLNCDDVKELDLDHEEFLFVRLLTPNNPNLAVVRCSNLLRM